MRPDSRTARLALAVVLALFVQPAVFSFVLLNARRGDPRARVPITLRTLPAPAAEEVAEVEQQLPPPEQQPEPAIAPPEEHLEPDPLPTTAPVAPTPRPSAPEVNVGEEIEAATETAPPVGDPEPATGSASRAPATRVFAVQELDQPPRVLERVRPVYPEEARQRRLEGRALLEVLVEVDGTVSEVRLVKSVGDEAMDRASIEAVRQWLFAPPIVAGRVVRARVVITVNFSLM